MQLIRPTAGLSGRVCVKLPGRHASHLCRGETGETMKRDVRHGGGSVYPLQGAAQAISGAISQNGGPEAHVWMIIRLLGNVNAFLE